METINIKGVLTTVGPLSIAMPKPESISDNEWKRIRPKVWGGFPVMTRPAPAPDQLKRTGYLPGTTLRGYLRRAIVIRAMRAAADAGKHYSLPDAYRDLIGQDAESERPPGDIDLDEIAAMRADSPIMDLFGSGLGVASRLRVGHFLPAANVLPELFLGVRKDLEQTEGVLECLSEEDQRAYRKRSVANTRRAVVKRALDAAKSKADDARKNKRPEAELAELDAAVKAEERTMSTHKEEMGGMEISTKTITDYYALGVGLALHGRIVVVRASERDLEMIEYGLDCLSRDPVLGAQSARGCGEVEGKFTVYVDGEEVKVIEVGGYEPARVTSLR